MHAYDCAIRKLYSHASRMRKRSLRYGTGRSMCSKYGFGGSVSGIVSAAFPPRNGVRGGVTSEEVAKFGSAAGQNLPGAIQNVYFDVAVLAASGVND